MLLWQLSLLKLKLLLKIHLSEILYVRAQAPWGFNMAEYSRLARGKFTSTGGAQVINLPFQPDHVRFINYTTANSAVLSQTVVAADWDAYMGQGFAVQQGYNATPTLQYD